MLSVIFYIILTVICVGLALYSYVKTKKYNALDDDYYELAKRHEQTCKELALASKENKILQQEIFQLNQAPKAEKISKPRKATAKKTTKK